MDLSSRNCSELLRVTTTKNFEIMKITFEFKIGAINVRIVLRK